VLHLDEPAGEIVNRPAAESLDAQMNGDTRATGVHDAARASDEIFVHHDLVARDRVQDRDR
jgi:hypothetical protein